ncbi:MAG: YbaK/EbsC family protein [Halobacteriales archaeon]
MDERVERFVETAAERYGLTVDVHEFEEGTKTAAEAADRVGCDVAQIGSSIVFMVDAEPVVVITSGANRVSEDRLADIFDADSVRMAEPEEVKEATGWSIGGVPPFCHTNTVRTLMDETLFEHEEIWVAAGTPQAVFPLDPERVRALADAEPAAVAE